jgi:hypothetical protein
MQARVQSDSRIEHAWWEFTAGNPSARQPAMSNDADGAERRQHPAAIAGAAKRRGTGIRPGTALASPADMQALLLNGALAGDAGLDPIDRTVAATLAACGWTVERVRASDLFMAYCKGCFDCWVKTPGVCATRDSAAAITCAIVRSDLAVLLSPVTFGGYSSEIKKVLDRSIGLVSPFFTRIGGEVHHKPRYPRYPALLAVGVMADRDPDQARIFARLVGRNAINFHAPASSVVVVSRDDSADQVAQAVTHALALLAARRGAA